MWLSIKFMSPPDAQEGQESQMVGLASTVHLLPTQK